MDNIITELSNLLKELKNTFFDNKSEEQENTLETINNIKHESFSVSYKKKDDYEDTSNNKDEKQIESKQNGDYITDEINKVRPSISENNQFWFMIVFILLVLLLFVPGGSLGWYCYSYINDQEQNKTLTSVEVVCKAPESVKDIIGMCMENCTDKCIQNNCVGFDKKDYYIIKVRQKNQSSRVIVLGICAAILIMAILCSIVIYIGFLRKKQENNSAAQNAIVEFNKRIYAELVHLKTAEAVFNKQLAEQELEMYKRAELIKFDEIQKYYDHKRKCELKEYELKEKYLNKVAEMVNKNLEIQKIDKGSK